MSTPTEASNLTLGEGFTSKSQNSFLNLLLDRCPVYPTSWVHTCTHTHVETISANHEEQSQVIMMHTIITGCLSTGPFKTFYKYASTNLKHSSFSSYEVYCFPYIGNETES